MCPRRSGARRSIFCLTPPIGHDVAVELDLARHRDLVPVVDVAAELLEDCRARTRARPTGRRRRRRRSVPSTGAGCSPAWSAATPTIDRSDVARVGARSSSGSPRAARRRADVEHDARARLLRAHEPAQVVGRAHGLAVDRDDHVGRLELADGGRVAEDRPRRARRSASPGRRSRAARSATAAAIDCERVISRRLPCRRLASLTPGRVERARAGRASRPRGCSGRGARATSPCGRGRRRSRSRRRSLRAASALDRDERVDGVRAVGEEDVRAVRRREQQQPGDDARAGRARPRRAGPA